MSLLPLGLGPPPEEELPPDGALWPPLTPGPLVLSLSRESCSFLGLGSSAGLPLPEEPEELLPAEVEDEEEEELFIVVLTSVAAICPPPV